jgi:hypothetical protein
VPQHPDDTVSFVHAVSTFECHSGLSQSPRLQQLAATPGLEHPKRPVLSISLRSGDGVVRNLKPLIGAVESGQERSFEVVSQASSGILLDGEGPTFGGDENVEGLFER